MLWCFLACKTIFLFQEGQVCLALEFMSKGSLAGILKTVHIISEGMLGAIAYQVYWLFYFILPFLDP